MIDKEFRTTGQIGNDGKLRISGQEKMNIFTRKFKNHKIIVEVKVIGTEASRAICGYFREYVVPEFRKAMMEQGEYVTLKGAEEFITTLSPILQKEKWDEDIKEYRTESIKFEDLDNYEAVHCLTDLKQIAAMEFGFEIKDNNY